MVRFKSLFNLILMMSGLALGSQVGFGQSGVLKGRIVEKESGNPISFCTVALVGTSIGSITDKDGFFEIKNLPNETLNIVVSHIAYDNRILVYDPKRLPESLIIKLDLAVVELDQVEINTKGKGKVARKRRRELGDFMDMVLGNDYDDKDIEVTNNEIIDLKDLTSKSTIYSANYDLNFVNRYLGYEINYYNFSFYMADKAKSFFGYPVFTEMEPENNEQQKQWDANREKAYYGSLRHFLLSLIENKVAEENFLANVTNYNPSSFDSKKMDRKTDVIRMEATEKSAANVHLIYNEQKEFYELSFDGVIEVFYVGPGTEELETTPLSYLKVIGTRAIVYPNGVLKDPLSIMTFGYLANQGVYEMLPSNYLPKKK
ncbi:carboxypeptidase-like regulatory domain-containing protein [Roseivirga echinicomitans]|uniref:TonB-dependent receptor plug domain-containing protein n=1 Tax=Roseivirga echinicomitans TaxID=296218 RepID=A0A150X338_9BACT|nr:carboxypeptidase-like regulatory domain-containing protein [Roseivirga echinicomitans]KYG73117.1 hypothetical protein AWN68_10545 [Roseivirga echinicomitans]